MSFGLFPIDDYSQKATLAMQGAAQSYGAMQKKQYVPGKTIGGGISNMMGGGMAGYALGSAIGGTIGGTTATVALPALAGAGGGLATVTTGGIAAGPFGLAAGAILGGLAYFLS